MHPVLDKYKEKGSFQYSPLDSLSRVCNAPRHSSGIYLIHADVVSEDSLIYIGISGREDINCNIKHRKDGLGGRIVKGKQFGEPRRRAWPDKMQEDGIEILHVMWYITYGKYNDDFPRPIEVNLLEGHIKKYGRLPVWNKEV